MTSKARVSLIGIAVCALCACNITQPNFEIAPYKPVSRESLPSAVIKAFKAEYPSARITETEFRPWLQGGKGDHYRITFEDAGARKQIAFRENGRPLGQERDLDSPSGL